MFATFTPALLCLFVMIQRVPYKGKSRLQSRSRRRRQRAIIVVILLVVFVSVSNYATRGDRQTIAEAFSLNYFITNLANTSYHIGYTTQLLYGLSSMREFLYVGGFSVSDQIQNATDFTTLAADQYQVVFNQSPSVYSYAWSDFGRFGILYMFGLGFISSRLYRQIWVTNSPKTLLFGCLVSGVWLLGFHGFQLALIEFWWNVFVLAVIFRSYSSVRESQPNTIEKAYPDYA